MHDDDPLVRLRHFDMHMQAAQRIAPRNHAEILRDFGVAALGSHLLFVRHRKRVRAGRDDSEVKLAAELCQR